MTLTAIAVAFVLGATLTPFCIVIAIWLLMKGILK